MNKRLSMWWLVVIVPALAYAALMVYYVVTMGAMHNGR